MNSRLRRCPTCFRGLDDETRMNMGLRNGEILNSLCPGLNGPSDIDHVLHNGNVSPERVMFYEYKRGVPLGTGQSRLFKALAGDWHDVNDGRLLAVRFVVLQQHQQGAEEQLAATVDWLWPSEQGAA